MIHNLGHICHINEEIGLDTSTLFFNKTQIFPYKFRSSRIYWSTKYPLRRTLYVFEILAEEDLSPEERLLVVEGEERIYKTPTGKKMIIKVTIMDDGPDSTATDIVSTIPSHAYIYSPDIELIYRMISTKVRECLEKVFPSRKQRLPTTHSFGLNATQFFGLSYSYVRHAIEKLPFSIAAVLQPPDRAYLPSFVLFSSTDLIKFEQLQFAQRVPFNAAGCAKAQGWEVAQKKRTGRITRNLAKEAVEEGEKE